MKRFLMVACCLVLTAGCIYGIVLRVRAEQVGSSPTNAATSRIKAVYDSITALSYGSIAAGTWGDWGSYWNRIRSAAEKPFNDAVARGLWNGSGTGSGNCTTTSGDNCYTKVLGGVDDYNRNQTIPADSYSAIWITCNSSAYTPANPGGNYCNTGRSVLNNLKSQDPNTGLVWSPSLGTSNWFTANNCKYPNNLVADVTCDADNELACICVKHTGGGDAYTGCTAYDSASGWRLPTQKELMQSYIDGSWGNLASAGANYWSATTKSANTHYAWYTGQTYGYTGTYLKTDATLSVRCVR